MSDAMDSREFDTERDTDALQRIWREVGWIEDKKSHRAALDTYLAACRTRVCDVNGEAEIAVSTAPGTMRVLQQELPLSIVAGVYTGLVGRQQGIATRLAAECIARLEARICTREEMMEVCVRSKSFSSR